MYWNEKINSRKAEEKREEENTMEAKKTKRRPGKGNGKSYLTEELKSIAED